MLLRGIAARALVLPLAFAGCQENPVAVQEEELSVELMVTPDHAHTLAPVTFTAMVKDRHGKTYTEFDTLRVERREPGGEWRKAVDLAPSAGGYTGQYTFMNSGAYELRVTGRRHGHSAMEEIEMARHMEALTVGRAHVNVGNYRIEFETFPGHIHEGDAVMVKYWVRQAQKDAAENRPAVTGLVAEITCTEPTGIAEKHVAHETQGGVYYTAHLFAAVGTAKAKVRFTTVGDPVEASFDLRVAGKH